MMADPNAGMTAADWQALADAKAAGGSQYLEALAAQSQAIAAEQQAMIGGLPGVPGGTLAVPNNVSATSTSSSVGQDAINSVQTAFPNLAWLLSVPEVAPLIIQAAQTNMDPSVFQAEFESTNWYKQSSQSVRNWIAEVETDPAQGTADLQAQESSIFATLSQLGVGALPQQVVWLAQQSLAFGWTPQEIKDHISNSTKFNSAGQAFLSINGISAAGGQAGTLQASIDTIHSDAAKYLVPISQSTAESFANSMANGTMDQSGVDAYLQQQAASLYPSIAGAIKQGITPADYVTPYKEVAAQLLGVSPNSIDMTQQKWNRALTAPSKDGTPQAMSLYDWQQLLMKDPQYNYMKSINAKDRASSIAQGLAEMFGRVASGPSGSTAFSNAGAPRIPGVPIT